MSPSKFYRRTLIVGAAAALLVATGYGVTEATGLADAPASNAGKAPRWEAGRTAPKTGTISQMDLQQAISTTLAGLDKNALDQLDVVTPAPGATTRPGLWMNATISAASSDPSDYMLPKWEAFLAQGAIADRIAGQTSNLADVISGSTIMLQAPDLAEPREVEGGAGDAVAGQIFGAEAAKATDEAITARVQETLKSFGLQSADVRVLHPLGPAVAVMATVPDGASATDRFSGLLAAIQGDGEYEGVYLELKDQAGQPLAIVGTADRISAGTQWFADGMDNLLGIGHGGATTLSLPSKPAPN